MSPACPTYTAPPGFQLGPQGGATAGFDCTAWEMSVAIAASTCGQKHTTGRQIRLWSTEPVPDPRSPGLNLAQVAAVALEHFDVYFEVHAGDYAVSWSRYEANRRAGRPTIIQLDYAAIASSMFDAGRGFGRNGRPAGHAFAETRSTYDSLADGRAPGVWRWDSRLYPRALIQTAAARLVVNPATGAHPRPGTVWAAFGPDVVPALPSVPYGPSVPEDIRALDPPGRSAAVWIMRTGHGFGSRIDIADFARALQLAGISYGGVVNVGDVINLRDWRP